MATIAIKPASESDAERLDTLADKQRELYRLLNEIRWENFKNREKIFEKTVDDIPNTDLPETTEEILLHTNAQDWADHILQAVKTAHISRMKSSDILSSDNLWYDKTTIASPINRFPDLCIKSADLQYHNEQLRVESDVGSVTFDITEGEEKIADLKGMPLYIYNTSTGYVLEPYDVLSEPTPGLPRDEKPDNDDYQAVLRTLSVAASVTAVTQVEPRKENDAFPKLFKEVGLYWKKVDTDDPEFDTYLVGTQKRGKQRIEEFLNTEKQNRTITQYCDLLGIPSSVGEYYCESDWVESKYDRYSAEEFALYGILSGDIPEESARYLLYSPYRPPPDVTEVRYAIQFAKQFQEGLNILYNEAPTEGDYDRLMKYYEQHNDQRSLLRDKQIIEVYNWLVECKNADTITTQEQ